MNRMGAIVDGARNRGRSRCPAGIRGKIGTVEQARIAAREVVSFGYDCGVKSDKWEMSE